HCGGKRSLAEYARDFACGLPLRSRPQNGSSSKLSGRAISNKHCGGKRSLAEYARDFACGLSPHHANTARDGDPQAPASLTPAKRLKLSTATWIAMSARTSCRTNGEVSYSARKASTGFTRAARRAGR